MILYCGICYHDQGVFRILTIFKNTAWCSWCQAERLPKSTVSRYCTMPLKEVAEPSIYHIAHIISGPEGKAV